MIFRWPVGDLKMTCTWSVHDLYTIYRCSVDDLYMMCTWSVHGSVTCSIHGSVHDPYMICRCFVVGVIFSQPLHKSRAPSTPAGTFAPPSFLSRVRFHIPPLLLLLLSKLTCSRRFAFSDQGKGTQNTHSYKVPLREVARLLGEWRKNDIILLVWNTCTPV